MGRRTPHAHPFHPLILTGQSSFGLSYHQSKTPKATIKYCSGKLKVGTRFGGLISWMKPTGNKSLFRNTIQPYSGSSIHFPVEFQSLGYHVPRKAMIHTRRVLGVDRIAQLSELISTGAWLALASGA